MKFTATFEIEINSGPRKVALALANELAYDVVRRHKTAMLEGKTKEMMKDNDPVVLEYFETYISDAEKMLKSLKVEPNG